MKDESHIIKLDVAHDFVAGLAKLKKPIIGIEELIWNALDADANQVDVSLGRGPLDGLETIVVTDDGHGIAPEEGETSFGVLGGSAKRLRSRSPGGRMLHGREGKGRFRAFGLGARVEWRSRFKTDGSVSEWSIKGDAANLCAFTFTDPSPRPKGSTGTSVTVMNVDATLGGLTSASARLDLLTRLALYLRLYPKIVVRYDDEKLDIGRVQQRTDHFELSTTAPTGEPITGTLTVIEWVPEMERCVYLCTSDGMARQETTVDIRVKGFNFTAYLRSPIFDDMDSGAIEVAEMDPRVTRLVDTARIRLREHFDQRKKERLEEVIAGWKAEGVYPYAEAPSGPVAKAEREVFDICAISIHQRLPDFASIDVENRKLTMRLLRHALETSPSSVQTILREVLNLPKYQQDDLASLLQKTRLESIITATKVVTDRLTFISALERLLFDKDYKNRLLERSQLQPILLNELWIFGEQYILGLDDQSLKTLLESHAKILDRKVLAKVVRDINGDEAIPDLMLWRRYADRSPGRYEHLVVELKRPKKLLGQIELSQIENYALTVAADERFDKTITKWMFVLVGDDLDTFAREKCDQENRPFGLIVQKPHVEVWVKRWATIIQECKWRHEFYRDKLELEVQSTDATEYLAKKYAQYLPSLANNIANGGSSPGHGATPAVAGESPV
jgi:Histidine kinase-, DNA gyrase B-, and HSP90-like ATPase